MADPPAAITAEWTVHAQLTILRGDHLRPTHDERTTVFVADPMSTTQAAAAEPTSYSSSATSAPTNGGEPLRVVYKWSSDDLKAAGCNGRGSLHFGGEQKNPSFKSNSTSDSGCCPHPVEGRLDGDADTADCNPKCRSTCSILLSACTDLYPTPAEGHAMGPPQYKTTATCVVTPSTEKIYRHCHTTPLAGAGEHLAHFLSMKDAICQTSDVECKAKSEPRTAQTTVHRTRSQRAYGYRRATESSLFQSSSLLSPNISFEEGTTLNPHSRQSSHSPVLIRQVSSPSNRAYSPNANVRVHHNAPSFNYAKNTSSKSALKKQPRTVHIDVYCTGSEAEDSEDSLHSDGSSSSSYAQHHHPHHFHFDDDASNSTPQTVFNANQIKLHHSRITNRRELPRRLGGNQMADQLLSYPTKPGQLRQFLLDQAKAKHEISKSKQMLLTKHMGADQHEKEIDDDLTQPPEKFSFSRHQGNFCQVEPSEGGFSSNYPNSSRSTFRDPTCSSISSAMASSSAVFEDFEQYAPNLDCNLSNADSFEYENAADRARIMQMEQAWKEAGNDEPTKDGCSNKGWRSPEKERKFMLRQKKLMEQNQHQIREATEEESPARSMTGAQFIYNNVAITPRHHRVLFTPSYEPTDQDMPRFLERSPSLSHEPVGGAQHSDNLSTRFGTRLESSRKKHYGPAKNPDCPCDHCRRYVNERSALQMRGRTMSMGEEQMTSRRPSFWLTRH